MISYQLNKIIARARELIENNHIQDSEKVEILANRIQIELFSNMYIDQCQLMAFLLITSIRASNVSR